MTRLVFTAGDDPYGLVIRAGSLSSISHVAIGLGGDGGPLLHAYEAGVTLEPRSKWFGELKQRLVAEFIILPDVSDGLRVCLSQVGKPYDVVGALKIGVLRALQIFGSPIQSLGKGNRRAFTCTHFVMQLDPDGCRIPEWRLIDYDRVVPADLFHVAGGPSFRRIA